jgi:predicted nucleic acid-binding Zn ribbon protein
MATRGILTTSMPNYDYLCPSNGRRVEVFHPMNEKLRTWGELCARAGISAGDTPEDAPVEKLISAPGLSFPSGNSKLKEMGFTKLVRRDKGVYENVTASGDESRVMRADDPSSVPDLSRKISD